MNHCPAFTLLIGERCRLAWPAVADDRGDNEPVRVVELKAGLDAPDSLAAETARVLGENGYRGDGLMLAIPSEACFAVTPPADFPNSAADHEALAYAVEPLLPVAAEEITVAMSGDATRALCLAAISAQWLPIVEALESQAIVVQAICPSALLALQTLLATEDDCPTSLIFWQCDDRVECFSLADGELQAWRHAAAEPSAVSHALAALSLSRSDAPPIFVVNVSEHLRDVLPQSRVCASAAGVSIDFIEAAAHAASEVLSGNCRPLVDLRIGPLASCDRYRPIRGPLRLASACAALLLIASLAAMLIRGHRLCSMAENLYRQQETIFRGTLPGQPIPAGITSRLRSELGKLTIATGGAPASSRSSSPTALEAMRRFLAALPGDIGCRVSDIRLDGMQIDIDGETLSHSDADKIAAALRGQAFDVQPPRSRQQADGLIGVHWSAGMITATSPKPSTHR